MRTRCLNPASDSYYLYGARGITVFAGWAASFEAFWTDMGRTWFAGSSIDRIDNDGNYEPGNCRWATDAEQANNRRTERLVGTPQGVMSMTEAATRFGLKRETIAKRLRSGIDDPIGLVAPPRNPHAPRGNLGPRRKKDALPNLAP